MKAVDVFRVEQRLQMMRHDSDMDNCVPVYLWLDVAATLQRRVLFVEVCPKTRHVGRIRCTITSISSQAAACALCVPSLYAPLWACIRRFAG